MLKSRAIEIKGAEANDLIKMLNKVFGGEEEQKEPTDECGYECDHGPDVEESHHMEVAKTSMGIFKAHIAVGFTEEQAFEILKAIIMA